MSAGDIACLINAKIGDVAAIRFFQDRQGQSLPRATVPDVRRAQASSNNNNATVTEKITSAAVTAAEPVPLEF